MSSVDEQLSVMNRKLKLENADLKKQRQSIENHIYANSVEQAKYSRHLYVQGLRRAMALCKHHDDMDAIEDEIKRLSVA